MNQPEPGPGEPPVPGDALITADEVARIFGGHITSRTVTRAWRRWGLQPVRIGRELRWWRSHVYQWLKNHRA